MRTHKMITTAAMICLIPGASGCAPGSIAWHDGEGPLRTAWFTQTPWNDAHLYGRIALSTAEIPCVEPSVDDPLERQAQIAELIAGVCREDARHVTLDLWWPVDSDVAGWFPGDNRAQPGDEGAPERFSTATYIGLDEVRTASYDDLIRTYEIVERETYYNLGGGGEVTLRTGDDLVWRGAFSFPEAQISGTFAAEACVRDGPNVDVLFDLFDDYGRDPTLLCGL